MVKITRQPLWFHNNWYLVCPSNLYEIQEELMKHDFNSEDRTKGRSIVDDDTSQTCMSSAGYLLARIFAAGDINNGISIEILENQFPVSGEL